MKNPRTYIPGDPDTVLIGRGQVRYSFSVWLEELKGALLEARADADKASGIMRPTPSDDEVASALNDPAWRLYFNDGFGALTAVFIATCGFPRL